jgi:hypothetical protein
MNRVAGHYVRQLPSLNDHSRAHSRPRRSLIPHAFCHAGRDKTRVESQEVELGTVQRVDGVSELTEVERYLFDLHGFVVRRGVLDQAELASLNAAIDGLRLPVPDHTIGRQRFQGHLEQSESFRSLIDHPASLAIVRELCGATVRLDHTYGIVMSPNTSGLDLHGGPVPFDPAQYFVVRDGAMQCGLVAVQWALTDHWPGNGGFCCIPGSHRSAFPVPTDITMQHAVVREVPMRAGDVVVFTEALVHGTLPWTAEHQRRTVLYKYSPGSSSWARNPAATDEELRLMTPRQRLLCQPPSVAAHEPVR